MLENYILRDVEQSLPQWGSDNNFIRSCKKFARIVQNYAILRDFLCITSISNVKNQMSNFCAINSSRQSEQKEKKRAYEK